MTTLYVILLYYILVCVVKLCQLSYVTEPSERSVRITSSHLHIEPFWLHTVHAGTRKHAYSVRIGKLIRVSFGRTRKSMIAIASGFK